MPDWINEESLLYKKVKEVVNKNDLMGLMRMCPDDEYESEIVDILNRCSYLKNINQIKEGLYEIFVYWFSEDYGFTHDDFQILAEDLCKIFKNKDEDIIEILEV